MVEKFFGKTLCLVQDMFAVGLKENFILGCFLCPTVLEHETQKWRSGGQHGDDQMAQ